MPNSPTDPNNSLERLPFIAWDQPAEIIIPGHGTYYGCRYCIGRLGVKAQDIIKGCPYAPATEKEWLTHWMQNHDPRQ